MMRIITNRQTCCALRLRIDPQQDLVRELIAGGCSGLPKGDVEDIPFGVIGDAGCFHRFSPPVPKDLVSGDDKIVLRAARNKAEPDNDDDCAVAGGQIFKVSVIEEHIGTDRILKSSASLNRLQHLTVVALHFRMLFADVVPAFIGQINLMAQLIFDRLQHRLGLLIKVNLLGLRVPRSLEGSRRFHVEHIVVRSLSGNKGDGNDRRHGVAVDAAGNVYVAGSISSSDFPTENALDLSFNGGGFYKMDVVVAKIDSAGKPLVHSTYLGGTGDDFSAGIGVDAEGNAYLIGDTASADFSTTIGAD
jgi:hypothetical protein